MRPRGQFLLCPRLHLVSNQCFVIHILDVANYLMMSNILKPIILMIWAIAGLSMRCLHHNAQAWMDDHSRLKNRGKLPTFFVESHKIDWQQRVAVQSVIQQNIDHSISSTINLPKGTDAGFGWRTLHGRMAPGAERHHCICRGVSLRCARKCHTQR